MGSEVEFQDEGLRKFLGQIDKNLASIKGGKKEYSGLMSALVFQDVLSHFEQEKGSDGKWQPWSSAYADAMAKAGYGGNKKLQFSGRLRQNFKPTSFRSVKDGVLWFNDAQTKGGFPYAFAHDAGGDKLPKREFMWLSDAAMEKIADQTLQFLIEKGIK